MLIILSPAKSLNYQDEIKFNKTSDLIFPDETKFVLNILRRLSISEIMSLMGISDKLATLNFYRYQNFYQNQLEVKKQAIFAFNGDVYDGLQAKTLDVKSLNYLQKNLKILSGLYGVLEPFNILMPYRLEMGIKLLDLKNGGKLHNFWRDKITLYLNSFNEDYIINLTSKEYFNAIDINRINKKIINIEFKDLDKRNNYKIITFYSKFARGLFARFMAENKIKKIEDLKEFKNNGYCFSERYSSDDNFVFLRDFRS